MGYMSQEFNIRSSDVNYPFALNTIIIHFSFANMFLSFDLVYQQYRDCLQDFNKETIIKSPFKDNVNDHFNVCTSDSFDFGKIHRLKIKCLTIDKSKHDYAYEFFGYVC